MESWDEIRFAYQVARIGTVSGAAHALGVHHATVIRHIDCLENRVGTRLFQRHARGYTPTAAGEDLLRVAQTTHEQFIQLAGRIRGQRDVVAGELLVTSLESFSHILTPILVRFQRVHPDLSVRYLTGARLFRLEYGEAHVAIRAGSSPQEPDNVVQKLAMETIALYGSKEYVETHGMPGTEGDLKNHRIVRFSQPKMAAPFNRWLEDNTLPEQATFKVSDQRCLQQAIVAGAGLGFMPESLAGDFDSLVKVMPSRPAWNSKLWLVTHVDMHRTAKVQAFLNFLKAELADG